MIRRGLRCLFFGCVMAAWAGPLWAAPTSAPAQEVPWSKEVDGLVCRLVAPKEVAFKEPLVLTMEVKNVSNRPRYLIDMTKVIQGAHYINNQCAELWSVAPNGKENRPGVHAGYSIVPNDFKPIAPGEVKKSYIRMTADMTLPGLASPAGQWKFTLALTSPKPARAVVANVGKVVNGQMVAEPVYGDPTKEQVENAWVGTLQAEATVRVSDGPPKLVVHEWGVFCSFADAKYANANLKKEWESMPPEFCRQFPDRKLRKVQEYDPNAVVEKPIIYFYTDRQNLSVDVKVKFAQGAPVVWWPMTAEPLDDFRVKQPGLCQDLHWKGTLKADGSEDVGSGWTVAKYAIGASEDSWITKARLESAAWFFTDDAAVRIPVSQPPPAGRFRSGRMFSYRNQSERFVYYDGLVPAVNYLSCEDAGKGMLKVTNSAKFKVGNVILLDRRDEKNVRAARIKDEIAPGATVTVAIRETRDAPAAAGELLAADLKAAGLYEPEVKSMLAIWEKGLFDRPGITALYLLPQAEYDRMLPLTISPAPQKIVRVGIVLQGQVDLAGEALSNRVRKLIADLDADQYKARDRAAADLAAIGPAAFGAIRKAMEGKLSAEAKERLEGILKNDAESYLSPRSQVPPTEK